MKCSKIQNLQHFTFSINSTVLYHTLYKKTICDFIQAVSSGKTVKLNVKTTLHTREISKNVIFVGKLLYIRNNFRVR